MSRRPVKGRGDPERIRLSIRLPLHLAFILLWLAGAVAAAPVDAPETVRWSSSVGEVVFPHLRHAEEFGAECVACHHETVAADLEIPHPTYFDDFWVDCKVCHTGSAAPAVQGKCVACHPERASGLNLEMPTVKVAIHRSCWSCHDRGTGTEATKQCGFCHQRTESTEVQTTQEVPPVAPASGPASE